MNNNNDSYLKEKLIDFIEAYRIGLLTDSHTDEEINAMEGYSEELEVPIIINDLSWHFFGDDFKWGGRDRNNVTTSDENDFDRLIDAIRNGEPDKEGK